jgi:hypothetical protein
VAGAKVLHHLPAVYVRQFLVIGSEIVESVNIAYHEEKIVIDTIVATHLFHRLFAKPQMYAKPW